MPGMCITINAKESCTGIPDSMTAEGIREATIEDECLSTWLELILHSWPSTETATLLIIQ